MPTVPATANISLDLPSILVLPASVAGQPLETWQTLVTQTFQPLAELAPATALEWDWVNPELGAITVETLRELISRLSFGVGPTTRRLVAVLAADLAPVQAQNTLLKSLEEPPSRTTLILAVTSPANLLPTILSRCQTRHVVTDLVNSSSHPSPELAADLEILSQLGRPNQNQGAATITHSQLIQLASRYKDRVSAQNLLRQWLMKLYPDLRRQPTSLTTSQLKLAQATLVALSQLDQNLSPALVLEKLWFTAIGPV